MGLFDVLKSVGSFAMEETSRDLSRMANTVDRKADSLARQYPGVNTHNIEEMRNKANEARYRADQAKSQAEAWKKKKDF